MEDKGGTVEFVPPPAGAGAVTQGGTVPQGVNVTVERNPGMTMASPGGGGLPSADGGVSGGVPLGRKKRGRPRKYDSDGNLVSPFTTPSPSSSIAFHGAAMSAHTPGFSLTSPSSLQFSSSKRGRGRGRSRSGNWKLLACLGEVLSSTAGGDFTPHILTVHTGEDVAGKILSFAQTGLRGICVLSANGTVSNVTIRQPGSSGGLLTYEGRFEILVLTGSFTICENGGVRSRTGGLSVSLAGPDGRVIGGGIAGSLLAASPIQIVVGSFMPNAFKAQKQKHYHDNVDPVIHGTPEMATSVRPMSVAAAATGGIIYPGASHFPVQSNGEENNSSGSKDKPNSTSMDTADWNSLEATLDQRPSPDINVSLSDE